jgi:TRAP-type C4-dicarboxylate transport system substrate-binding protein
MTPQQRLDARGRFQTWQQLPPGQQAIIRQRWQRFQQLSPQQQQAVRQNFHAYSTLPPAQRARLRERWLNATPRERMEMLQRQRQLRLERGGGQRLPPEHSPRAR